MTPSFQRGDFPAICASLGELIVRWNDVETNLHLLVHAFAPSSEAAVLMTHMGTTALCDALRTFALKHTEEPKRGTLLHFIEFFERMREYRNFVVHGIGHHGDKLAIRTFSARAGHYVHEASASEKECDNINERLETLFMFGAGLILHLAGERQPISAPPKLRLGLPEKPQLPDRLKKPRRSLKREAAPA